MLQEPQSLSWTDKINSRDSNEKGYEWNGDIYGVEEGLYDYYSSEDSNASEGEGFPQIMLIEELRD